MTKSLSLRCTDRDGSRGLFNLLALDMLIYEIKKLEIIEIKD